MRKVTLLREDTSDSAQRAPMGESEGRQGDRVIGWKGYRGGTLPATGDSVTISISPRDFGCPTRDMSYDKPVTSKSCEYCHKTLC